MCYWDEMLSEEECERGAGDPNWTHYLETLEKPPEVKKVMQSLVSGDPHRHHVRTINVNEECRI